MANLTNNQIEDSDALVSHLKAHGPMTAREIYAIIGRQTARVLGFAVQSGRVIKDGDYFKLPKSYTIVTTSPDYDWSNC